MNSGRGTKSGTHSQSGHTPTVPNDRAVVAVTGGGAGIGRYMALGFASRGSRVIVAESSPERCRKIADELDRLGSGHLVACVDVREEAAVEQLFAKVAVMFGRLDVLVNNAAIVPHFSWGLPLWPPARDMSFSFWSDVIATNLGGVFLCTRYALRIMVPQAGGHIVNVHGGRYEVRPGHCAYAVSKEAVLTFTRHVAEEEREHNICVVSVHPGHRVATEDAPLLAKRSMPGPESVGDVFFLAADADMSVSGKLVELVDGQLAVVQR